LSHEHRFGGSLGGAALSHAHLAMQQRGLYDKAPDVMSGSGSELLTVEERWLARQRRAKLEEEKAKWAAQQRKMEQQQRVSGFAEDTRHRTVAF
jgi:hypothetical protein